MSSDPQDNPAPNQQHAVGDVIDGTTTTLEQLLADIFWDRSSDLGTAVYTVSGLDQVTVSFPDATTESGKGCMILIRVQARSIEPSYIHQ